MTGNGKGKGSGNAAPKKKPAPKPPKQPAKQKRVPKKAHPSAPRARMENVFDAFNSRIPKTLLPCGKGLPVNGISRNPVSITTGHRALYLVSNIGGTGTVGYRISWSDAAVGTKSEFLLPTLASSASSGGPTSLKAATCTVEVLNTTQLYLIAGNVYVLHMDQRLNMPNAPNSLTVLQLDQVANTIRAHKDAKIYGASQFTSPMRFSCKVVDNAKYDEFHVNRGSLSLDNWAASIAQWPGYTQGDRPMSCVAVLIDSATQAAAYTVTVGAQSISRWPIDTITGQLMTDIPTGSADQVTSERKQAEQPPK